MRRESDTIIEFIRRGNVVKVTAIDAESGVEASIVGDPKASRQQLEDLAMQKLRWVQENKA